MKKNYRLLVLLLNTAAVYTTYSSETGSRAALSACAHTPKTFCSPRQRADTLTPRPLSSRRDYGFTSGSITDLKSQRNLSTAALVALQLQNAETTNANASQQ